MDANHGGNPHLELVARAVATPHGRGMGHMALRALAPQRIRHTPAYHVWADKRKNELKIIKDSIPQEIMDAVVPPAPVDGDIVAITDTITKRSTFALLEATEFGWQYHELWLDLSQ